MFDMQQEAVKAKNLLPEDYFDLAGQLYRIHKVKKDKKTTEVIIKAFPVTPYPERSVTIYTTRKALFVIYLQGTY